MITPLDLDPNLVRALGPEGFTPEITHRLRSLAGDLDRIAAGTAPTATDLKSAPLLVDWQLAVGWTGLCLSGFVAGHPLLGNRKIVTSGICGRSIPHCAGLAPCRASTAWACPPAAACPMETTVGRRAIGTEG